MLCAYFSCVPTRQGGTKASGRIKRSTTHIIGPMGESDYEFITSLTKSDMFGMIMVVVERFSKYTTFIPTTAGCTAKGGARLFFKTVLKYWGMPRHIISDRDLRFIGNFLRELFEIVGTKLHFSTSFHLQTDGHTECVKDLLECY